MKKLLTLITLSVLLFSGCGDDETVSSQGGGEIGTVTGINGKLFNLPNQSDLHLAFDAGYNLDTNASSSISPDGYFAISRLPKPRLSSITEEVYPRFAPIVKFQENTFVCSDTSSRACYASLRLCKDKVGTLGYVYRQKYGEIPSRYEGMYRSGYFFTSYIYVNRNVTMKGKMVYSFDVPEINFESHVTMTYDITYRKGWNRYVTYVKKWNEQKLGGKTVYTGIIEYLDKEPGPGYYYCVTDQSETHRTIPQRTESSGYNPLGIVNLD